ncbi:MAG: DinB family protein [Gemmatimonadales bacterium]
MATTPFTNPAGRAPAPASEYARSILSLLGEQDPVAVQAKTVGRLRVAIAGLSATALDRPESPGKWSVAQVIRHLADSEVVCGWRLRLVLSQDRPAVTGYDQDAWVLRLRGAYPDVASSLAVLDALRGSHLRLLRSLKPDEWAREGVHVERGPESVSMMAQLYAGHDLAHLNQIERIKNTLRL